MCFFPYGYLLVLALTIGKIFPFHTELFWQLSVVKNQLTHTLGSLKWRSGSPLTLLFFFKVVSAILEPLHFCMCQRFICPLSSPNPPFSTDSVIMKPPTPSISPWCEKCSRGRWRDIAVVGGFSSWLPLLCFAFPCFSAAQWWVGGACTNCGPRAQRPVETSLLWPDIGDYLAAVLPKIDITDSRPLAMAVTPLRLHKLQPQVAWVLDSCLPGSSQLKWYSARSPAQQWPDPLCSPVPRGVVLPGDHRPALALVTPGDPSPSSKLLIKIA